MALEIYIILLKGRKKSSMLAKRKMKKENIHSSPPDERKNSPDERKNSPDEGKDSPDEGNESNEEKDEEKNVETSMALVITLLD